jgi:transposase
MAEQRRKYPREFKIEAVRRVTEGRETAAEVARALGIQPNMLYGWVRQLKAEADDAFRGNGKLTAQDEEIRRLRRENADLREERDILKKTAVWFAKHSR